jgi:hypothetical protein
MDAGRTDVADTLRAHLRGLGDDQARSGALGVIGGGERIRHIAVERAAARHRRHHQSVPELDSTQAVRGQQVGRRRIRIRLPHGHGLLAAHDFFLLGGRRLRVTGAASCGTDR